MLLYNNFFSECINFIRYLLMIILGVVKEKILSENRVSLVPNSIKYLINIGLIVNIEDNAGLLAGFSNNDYIKNGANIVNNNTLMKSDIIICINFHISNLSLLKYKCIVICLYSIGNFKKNKYFLEKNKITLIVLSNIPRLSNTQSFDVLSTISYISGYRGVIEALYEYKNFFSSQIISTCELKPINMLILGVGIAGLSAISISKSLGAKIFCYDINKKTKEQVESLGVKFLEIENSLNNFLLEKAFMFDIIITAANNYYSNKVAPLIITENIIKNMKYGSIIVDLSMRNGGNCELSILNKLRICSNGVKIISYLDFSNLMPNITSILYSNNITNLLRLIVKNGDIFLDFNNKNIFNIIYSFQGSLNNRKFNEIKNKNFLSFSNIFKKKIFYYIFIFFLVMCVLFFKNILFSRFVVFILSFIIGLEIVRRINSFLHTPLMSITNAISGIISVGCLLQINNKNGLLVNLISLISLFLININIFAGFNITKRMLKIFYKN